LPGQGPPRPGYPGALANLATIRAAVIAVLKDADYRHIAKRRRDHTSPAESQPSLSTSTASIRTDLDV
jgi:hypothetical protein